uniref:hypothetical protein n=1 Tax=Ningiella ruwaisensis TaxID=2364274 RepID=UPI00109FB87C|nr:hypothetical protein [Ningiella ruwaisensis]
MSVFTSLGCLVFLCISMAFKVNAKQLAFSSTSVPEGQSFNYTWKREDTEYNLSFTLDTEAFKRMPSSSAAFSNALMQREIEIALLKYAQNLDPREAKVDIKRVGKNLQYGVSSRNEEKARDIMKALDEAGNQAKADYFKRSYFTKYSGPSGADAVKQDHVRYAKESADALMPVVEAIKTIQDNANDAREFIEIALSWMQSIPYDVMENRLSSNGAGFVSPKDLLLQNQGDCDSKATFLAALLQAYNQGVKQNMVLLPEHALLAVALNPQPNDEFITHKGLTYILLEAAGPGYFAVGEASDSTLLKIRNRQYTLEQM